MPLISAKLECCLLNRNMCGFGVTNKIGLHSSNQYCKKRGPDRTDVKVINGVEFLHNLLHITGSIVPQPVIKGDVVAIFNGEIYNYLSFGNYSSDAECIIDVYQQYGDKFVEKLDGEFAICVVDFSKQKLLIAVDTFACKPLWYEFRGDKFCIGSYNSQLTGLGFTQGKKLKANTTLVYDLRSLRLIEEVINTRFDIRQHKNTFDDWISAFSKSIKKRVQNTNKGMFVGMSSGYDSGAIACELQKQQANFKAYSIVNNENQEVLNSRLKRISVTEPFTMTPEEFERWKQELRNNCEEFHYQDQFFDYNIKKDQASMGLSAICHRANREGRRIYFSGQGADEIISDYGFGGKKIYKHSSFGGLFPNDLTNFFPWHSFWDGTQIQYLNKEEYVAGHFGIETRYPFLDRDLVQEFLWLSADLKNSKYKSCLDEYLKINEFPYQPSEKRGFHVVEKGKKTKTL
jgi:asparagine synthetase B (glutamine-hydrolysing)